jgi:hypothetical protein
VELPLIAATKNALVEAKKAEEKMREEYNVWFSLFHIAPHPAYLPPPLTFSPTYLQKPFVYQLIFCDEWL